MFRDAESALRLRIASLQRSIAEETLLEETVEAERVELRASVLELRRRLEDARPLGTAKRLGARFVFVGSLAILAFAIGSAAAAHFAWLTP